MTGHTVPTHRGSEGSLRQIPSGRMRKRDLVGYYGRRMIRKVSAEQISTRCKC